MCASSTFIKMFAHTSLHFYKLTFLSTAGSAPVCGPHASGPPYAKRLPSSHWVRFILKAGNKIRYPFSFTFAHSSLQLRNATLAKKLAHTSLRYFATFHYTKPTFYFPSLIDSSPQSTAGLPGPKETLRLQSKGPKGVDRSAGASPGLPLSRRI